MWRAYTKKVGSLALAGAAFALGPPTANAQNFTPPGGGGTVYVPYGAGGFIPYSSGPGGGLGVQSAMPRPMNRPATFAGGAARAAGGEGGMSATLGPLRATLTPLAPIRAGGSGMGMGGGLVRRAAPGAGMNAMGRPPVGGYPFRQPSSLGGPAGPGMGM